MQRSVSQNFKEFNPTSFNTKFWASKDIFRLTWLYKVKKDNLFLFSMLTPAAGGVGVKRYENLSYVYMCSIHSNTKVFIKHKKILFS